MKPVVLTILDGWGVGSPNIGNAVQNAQRPTFDRIEQHYPSTLLHASGIAVGVLWGDEGNSETGHITIGSGRIVYQSITRIIFAIRDGSFFRNEALLGAARHVKEHGGTLHLMGLVSSGSVHSYADHIYALFDFAKNEDIKNVALHMFCDGKDAPPNEGKKFVEHLQERLRRNHQNVKLASLIGRFYAMDRNNNWDRTEKTYNMLVKGEGATITSPQAYLKSSYDNNIFDGFIEPALVVENEGDAPILIRDNDAVVFFNFREDSARQISRAFYEDAFDKFERKKLNNLYFAGMTKYEDDFKGYVLFPPHHVVNGLGETLEKHGMRQLRIAETEKYAHVTYFFNGGREKPFEGEDRVLIPSAASRHFDENPKMSAEKIAETVLRAIDEEKHDLIVVNFANTDMVGHTGNYDAAIEATECVDAQVGKIMQKVLEKDGALVITADHGNADNMLDPQSGEPSNEHSMNPAPFYLVGARFQKMEPPITPLYQKNPSGFLADVAPTILELLGIPKPPEMTGNSLLSLFI